MSVDRVGRDRLTVGPISTGIGDPGLPFGPQILAFVDAVVLHDLDEYPTARVDLEIVAGRGPTDRVAMVAGNFSMMNRALDAIGTPVDPGFGDLAADLGVTVPEHLTP